MSNPQDQDTQTTSAGTSRTSPDASRSQINPVFPGVDDVFETVSQFEQKIAAALRRAAEKKTAPGWVETGDDIITYFNPNGLNGARYFIYKGVRVCRRGDAEAIDKEIATPVAHRMHGNAEGKTSTG